MTRKIFTILILMSLLAAGGTVAETASGQDEETGYALLDKLILMFQEMAAQGSGGVAAVEKKLSGIMSDARAAHKAESIDNIFFHRFQRLLIVIKLTLVEDEQGILGPLIQSEVERFVRETTGDDLNVTGSQAIGMVANSIQEGILDLHMYLKTKQDRAQIKREWEKQHQERQKKIMIK